MINAEPPEADHDSDRIATLEAELQRERAAHATSRQRVAELEDVRAAAVMLREALARALQMADVTKHGVGCDAHDPDGEDCGEDCPAEWTDEHGLEECSCTFGDVLTDTMLFASTAWLVADKERGTERLGKPAKIGDGDATEDRWRARESGYVAVTCTAHPTAPISTRTRTRARRRSHVVCSARGSFARNDADPALTRHHPSFCSPSRTTRRSRRAQVE